MVGPARSKLQFDIRCYKGWTWKKKRFALFLAMPPARRRTGPKSRKPGYLQSTIDKALRLLRKRKAGEKLSLRAIADRCNVSNPMTILRWSRQSMTEKARSERSAHKGPPRKLSLQEEMIAAGWVLYRHGLLVDTTSSRFFDFLSRAFSVRPSAAWLTKFKRRWHLSSRITRTSVPIITTRETYKNGVAFLKSIRDEDKEPDQFLFVDKITFNQPTRTQRSLAPKGRHACLVGCYI